MPTGDVLELPEAAGACVAEVLAECVGRPVALVVLVLDVDAESCTAQWHVHVARAEPLDAPTRRLLEEAGAALTTAAALYAAPAEPPAH